MIKDIFHAQEERMKKTLEALRRDFGSLRAGRATPALLDRVMVDYYGQPTPVSQVAAIAVPEPRMLMITPWEKTILHDIEKAIMKSDLGLTPNILSVCTTRTSVMKWVEDDSVVGVVPLEPLEVMPSGLRSLPIRDVDFALSKTVVKVKGRSLSMIAKKFLEFYGQLDEARRGKAVRKKSRVE